MFRSLLSLLQLLGEPGGTPMMPGWVLVQVLPRPGRVFAPMYTTRLLGNRRISRRTQPRSTLSRACVLMCAWCGISAAGVRGAVATSNRCYRGRLLHVHSKCAKLAKACSMSRLKGVIRFFRVIRFFAANPTRKLRLRLLYLYRV